MTVRSEPADPAARGGDRGLPAAAPAAVEHGPRRAGRPVSIVGAIDPADGPGDGDLLAAARAGDQAAFDALYRRHAPAVFAVALARCADRGAAEDAVQEVFLRLVRRPPRLRDDDAIGRWLLASGRTRAADARRALARWRRRAAAGPPRAVEQRAGGGDLRTDEVVSAISSLPAAYREALMLRLLAGLTGPEIAHRTGLSHGAVRVNLHRGLARLRALLAAAASEEVGA